MQLETAGTFRVRQKLTGKLDMDTSFVLSYQMDSFAPLWKLRVSALIFSCSSLDSQASEMLT